MLPAASPNFAFLAHHDPRLVVLDTQPQRYFAEDPNTCLVKLRQIRRVPRPVRRPTPHISQ
jgi:type I restriction enzyme R subunit